ncbi:hypothetical protein ABPG77_010108 [Micractinium sp. CCAP 211/92]
MMLALAPAASVRSLVALMPRYARQLVHVSAPVPFARQGSLAQGAFATSRSFSRAAQQPAASGGGQGSLPAPSQNQSAAAPAESWAAEQARCQAWGTGFNALFWAAMLMTVVYACKQMDWGHAPQAAASFAGQIAAVLGEEFTPGKIIRYALLACTFAFVMAVRALTRFLAALCKLGAVTRSQ